MQPGEEWAYRLRDSASSERVRIVSIIEGRNGFFRADVEFLDDAGRAENMADSGRRRNA
jgi:hypothetical protein